VTRENVQEKNPGTEEIRLEVMGGKLRLPFNFHQPLKDCHWRVFMPY
jgi:hypothetical protein